MTDPHCGVAMIAQCVARIRMHENIELAVVDDKPRKYGCKLFICHSKLIRPHRMRTNWTFMKAADFHGIAQFLCDDFAQGPSGVARLRIEIDMSVPAGNVGGIGKVHDELS
ncbi:hypothetical protein F4827_007065 [Paraburkholderia bannensis]|uniref:Uncharacterized protein n=1 Tax=Paraburkholderia bannensis TaxID=765414 RepID=A0A7W9U544_9BURK|nr:hypothetical protein [Paraburkholderia sp. WP4_3_2]MBB6107183.1 hypothetical protein [Paraburkholderia bannensis]